MMNMRLIWDAIDLVVEYEEIEHITEATAQIYERACAWYNHSEITDCEILAAVILTGELPCAQSWSWVMEAYNHFFPQPPEEHISVEELKEARYF